MCIGARVLYPIETGKSAEKRSREIGVGPAGVRDLNVIVFKGVRILLFCYRHSRPKRE